MSEKTKVQAPMEKMNNNNNNKTNILDTRMSDVASTIKNKMKQNHRQN